MWRTQIALSSLLGSKVSQAPQFISVDPRRILTVKGLRSRADAAPGTSPDEIVVHIGPNGELLLARGRAQLERARQQQPAAVSVRVGSRDPAWLALRAEILAYATAHGGRTYQTVLHPDLVDIPSGHGDRRFELIRDHLSAGSGKLLDIGAHWGYFCHRFEDVGFDCTAVESDPSAFYFLERLRRAGAKRFTSLEADVLHLAVNEPYDVVLALNIFHHFLKTAVEFHQLEAFLRRLRTRLMIFEPHCTEEAQMAGAYRNFGPDAFVAFVAANTSLTKTARLGEAEAGRAVYLLTRPA